MTSPADVRLIGRYALHGELASGGMAAVHLGRLLGPVGFARTVAIKRLHSHLARDPEFVRMFLDEARLVSRIKHPNVVPTLDIVALDGELFLVMEYVHGAPVSKIMMALARRSERMPVNVAVGITVSVLEGLHAAHEATSEEGTPLDIVHRDVSPQNIIVGADGIARVLDFGIAKAAERLLQTTEDGSFKGKLGYMPPDVLCGRPVDRRADLWAAGVVLWEMLVGKRLFPTGDSPHALVRRIVDDEIDPPSRGGAPISADLDGVLAQALMKEPVARFATARAMASALESVAPVASGRVISEWLAGVVGDQLEERAARVAEVERSSRGAPPSLRTVHKLAQAAPVDLPQPPLGSTSETMAAPSTVPDAPVDLPQHSLGRTSETTAAPSTVPDAPMSLAPSTVPDAPMSLAPSTVPDAPMSLARTLEIPVLPAMTSAAPPSEAPAPAPVPATRPRRRPFLALVSVLVAAAAAAASALVLECGSRPPLDASAGMSASASGPPHVETRIDAQPRAEASIVARPESAAVVAPAPSTPTSASPRGGSTRSAHGTKTGSSPRPGSSAPKSCNPPYTIGPPPDYIRKPKLECLPE